jgi:ComF family protein
MLNTIGNLLFGGSCFLCRGKADALLCAPCDADLPRLGAEFCPRCALASPRGAICGRCLTQAPQYDATVAALAYDFPADVLVQALKFRGELALAPFFAGLLVQKLAGRQPMDCILPVPLSDRRLRERGFNQALEIARDLVPATRARLTPGICERARDTPAQMELPLAGRAKNVRGAFHCPRLLAGAKIAVLDDVMTSGATLDEIAGTLKRAGAAHVENWVVARTFPPVPPH